MSIADATAIQGGEALVLVSFLLEVGPAAIAAERALPDRQPLAPAVDLRLRHLARIGEPVDQRKAEAIAAGPVPVWRCLVELLGGSPSSAAAPPPITQGPVLGRQRRDRRLGSGAGLRLTGVRLGHGAAPFAVAALTARAAH